MRSPIDPPLIPPGAIVFPTEPLEALRLASLPAREVMARDRRLAADRHKGVFAFLERHLFDRGLRVSGLNQRFGRYTVVSAFEGDEPPRCYIENRRIETAGELLAHTDLRIWKIATLVGYSNHNSFAHAFKRTTGERPRFARSYARSRPISTTLVYRLAERALRGEVEPQTAEALEEHLPRLDLPEQAPEPPDTDSPPWLTMDSFFLRTFG